MSEIKTCGPFAANTHIAHTHSTHTPIRTHLRTWLFSAVRNELTWRIINIKCYTYKLNKMAQLKLPARLLLLSTTRLMTWPSSSQSKYILHIYMLHIYECVCVCVYVVGIYLCTWGFLCLWVPLLYPCVINVCLPSLTCYLRHFRCAEKCFWFDFHQMSTWRHVVRLWRESGKAGKRTSSLSPPLLCRFNCMIYCFDEIACKQFSGWLAPKAQVKSSHS